MIDLAYAPVLSHNVGTRRIFGENFNAELLGELVFLEVREGVLIGVFFRIGGIRPIQTVLLFPFVGHAVVVGVGAVSDHLTSLVAGDPPLSREGGLVGRASLEPVMGEDVPDQFGGGRLDDLDQTRNADQSAFLNVLGIAAGFKTVNVVLACEGLAYHYQNDQKDHHEKQFFPMFI